jgi:hypothetical protein
VSIDHEPSHSPVAHSCRARTRTDGQARGYANKYRTIRMERRNGILQMTLHTDGGSLRWGFLPHGELPDAFFPTRPSIERIDRIHWEGRHLLM